MKKDRKPVAISFSEVDGYFTQRCKTSLIAKKAIEEAMREDERLAEGEEIKLEDVKADRYYYHKRCGFYNVGENTCCECGDPCGTNGRQTFTYYL